MTKKKKCSQYYLELHAGRLASLKSAINQIGITAVELSILCPGYFDQFQILNMKTMVEMSYLDFESEMIYLLANLIRNVCRLESFTSTRHMMKLVWFG